VSQDRLAPASPTTGRSLSPTATTVEVPEGFKMTELGPLPEEWELVRLRDLVNEGVLWMTNGFPQGKHNQNGDGVLHLRPFNITESGEIDTSQKKFVTPPPQGSRYWVLPGDVIFNNTNSEELIGKTAYVYLRGHFVLSNHMTLIRVMRTEIVETYYLAKYLHQLWYWGLFRQMCRRHVNQASVSLERLKQIFIPLPPLPEQRAIAQVLRTVQRAKEATERVIAALKELKKSLMRYLFTYGPVPVDQADQVALKETEVGPIPAHWCVRSIGEIAEVRAGVAFPHAFQGQGHGRFPFFKVSDMNTPGNESRLHRANNYVGEEAVRALRGKPFPPGTVVFPKVGGALHTNKKRLLALEGLIDNNMMGVIPRQNRVEAEFLYRWSEVVNLSDLSNPGPLPSITAQRVRTTRMPFPPKEERTEVTKILQRVDRKIEAEESRKRALEGLFKSLLHHLMTGMVRVKDLQVGELERTP
jgi:type I restriction enzyme S subunit